MFLSKAFDVRMASKKQSLGQHMRYQSNLIMDKTFSRDAGYKVCNLYDCNMHLLEKDIEVKFQFAQKYTLNKDQVEYYIQFRPGYFPEKKYRQADNVERFGFYIEIPDDESGENDFWLIVSRNDSISFKRYNILKCNWTIKYRVKDTIYSVLSVLRSRNNYNSGVWSDGFATTVENQIQFLAPTNDYTNLIDYDLRFMISDNPIHPIVYEVTKVEDCLPFGTKKITLKQTLYDPEMDNTPDKICDYNTLIIPEDVKTSLPTKLELKYNGTSPTLKLGGSARTITAFYQDDSTFIPEVEWKFIFLDSTYSTDSVSQLFNVDVDKNMIKISAPDNKLLANNILTIEAYDSSLLSTSIQLEVKR